MRISYFNYHYDIDGAAIGAATQVQDLAAALTRLGHRVDLQFRTAKSPGTPSREYLGLKQIRWLRDTFGAAELALERSSTLDAYDLLVAQAQTAPPGAEGLIFIPTFNGSSAPIVDLYARSCLLGLSLNHTRGHVIRALLEGISMELRWMLDAIKEAGAEVNAIYLAGGGASNSIWNQIHANIFDQSVHTLRISNAAMTGAAMCAAIGLGFYQDWQSAANAFIEIEAVLEPQPEHRPVYEQLYATYKDFFRLLSDSGLMRRLSYPTMS